MQVLTKISNQPVEILNFPCSLQLVSVDFLNKSKESIYNNNENGCIFTRKLKIERIKGLKLVIVANFTLTRYFCPYQIFFGIRYLLKVFQRNIYLCIVTEQYLGLFHKLLLCMNLEVANSSFWHMQQFSLKCEHPQQQRISFSCLLSKFCKLLKSGKVGASLLV